MGGGNSGFHGRFRNGNDLVQSCAGVEDRASPPRFAATNGAKQLNRSTAAAGEGEQECLAGDEWAAAGNRNAACGNVVDRHHQGRDCGRSFGRRGRPQQIYRDARFLPAAKKRFITLRDRAGQIVQKFGGQQRQRGQRVLLPMRTPPVKPLSASMGNPVNSKPVAAIPDENYLHRSICGLLRRTGCRLRKPRPISAKPNAAGSGTTVAMRSEVSIASDSTADPAASRLP